MPQSELIIALSSLKKRLDESMKAEWRDALIMLNI